MFNMVDLPHPLGPTSATNSSRWIDKLTGDKAVMARSSRQNDFAILSSVMSALDTVDLSSREHASALRDVPPSLPTRRLRHRPT